MRLQALLLVLVLAASASAQNSFHYPRSEPGRVTVTKDVEYRPGLRYDVYRPAGNDVVPVMIVANIGSSLYRGWGIYQGWGDAVANAGVAAVVYDATQENAIANFDALMGALRQRAASLRIDPARVVIWSGSANVQVGLPLAMDRSRDYIRGAVIYYGSGNAPEIRTDLPVLFVRAGLDSPQLNADIDRLIARALAANAPWSIESHGSGLHGFESLSDNDITRAIIDRTLAFVKLVTQPPMAAAFTAGADDARAGAAFSRGEWPASIDAYRQRVTANPSDAESHRRLGLSLSATRQYAEALTHLEKAWQLGRRGTRDTVVPAFEAAAGAKNETRAAHWLDLAVNSQFAPPLAELRTHAAGMPALERILKEAEGPQRVIAAFDAGRSAEAMSEIQSAKSGRLASEAALLDIAYRQLARDRKEDAVSVFRIAAERYPRSANAWESLSEALEKTGSRTEAQRAAQKALELLPGDSSLTPEMRENVRRAAAERVARMSNQQSDVLDSLPRGPHAVGFEAHALRDYSRTLAPDRAPAVVLSTWYPAAASNGERMTFDGYRSFDSLDPISLAPPTAEVIAAARKATKDFFERPGNFPEGGRAPDEAWERLWSWQGRAVRGASPLAGRYPVIVTNNGARATAFTNEMLASHGYLVVAVGFAGAPTLTGAAQTEWSARSIEFALSWLRSCSNADVTRIGLMGFSGAGFPPYIVAMRNTDVDALATLESGLYVQEFAESLQHPSYAPERLRIPFLHLFRASASREDEDLSEYRKLRYAERYRFLLDGERTVHQDFSSYGPASILLGIRGDGAEEATHAFRAVNVQLLRFFDAFVKRDASSRAALVVDDADVTVEYSAAVRPAPSIEEARAMFGKAGAEEGMRMLIAARKEDPEAPVFADAGLSTLGFQLVGDRNLAAAKLIASMLDKQAPQSVYAHNLAGNILMNESKNAEAAAEFEKALEAISRSKTMSPEEQRQSRVNIQAKIDRLRKGA